MRNLLLLSLFLITIPVGSFAQRAHKSHDVIKTSASSIRVIVYYDDDMNADEYLFMFNGRNREYKQINDQITITSGSASDVLRFLYKLDDFATKFKDDDGISSYINEQQVHHLKKYGMRACYVFAENNRSYIDIMDKDIKKYIDALVKYCNTNRIEFDLTD